MGGFCFYQQKTHRGTEGRIEKVWSEYSDNAPTPTAATATEEEIDFLAAEAIRIQFGAKEVVG